MCFACAFPTASGDWTETGFAAGAEGLGDRKAALDALTAVLALYGLKLRAAGLTGGFRISTPSGRHAYASCVDDVWPAATELVGRCVDPLDPVFTSNAARERV